VRKTWVLDEAKYHLQTIAQHSHNHSTFRCFRHFNSRQSWILYASSKIRSQCSSLYTVFFLFFFFGEKYKSFKELIRSANRTLILATVASFYLQIKRVRSVGESSAISFIYLLLITISAMEQWTLYICRFIFDSTFGDEQSPRLTAFENLLNFFQMSSFLVCSTTL
jgi:hypothetical protein